MEKKSVKDVLLDNFLIYLIVAFAMVIAGQMLGSILINIPMAIWAGIEASQKGSNMMDILNQASSLLPPVVLCSLMYVTCIGMWIVVLLCFLIKKNRFMFKEISNAKKGNTVVMLVFGLFMGFAMNGACILLAYLHGDIELTFDSFQPGGLLVVFLCVFVQSSAEELICRVYLYQKLLHRYKKPVVAIVGNAVLFSFGHLMNDGVTVLALANIVLIGIVFSLIVHYFESVWCAFALHAAWNFNQNIIWGLPNSGYVSDFSIMKLNTDTARDSFAYNVGFGVEATLVALIVELMAVFGLLLYGRRKNRSIIEVE